jgi:7-cyano-7-deazaguanine reductase
VPAESANLIESKSFKLYLNSYNQTRFESWTQVETSLVKDLSACAGAAVNVVLQRINDTPPIQSGFEGICLDDQDVEIEVYDVDASLLATASEEIVSETLYSDLLRSNCPVTGQPDWGSVCIEYTGKAISREALLKYLVSFREHSGFHELCVETIFVDLLQHCAPSELTVYARYLRRGGLDINPLRSSKSAEVGNVRLARQ